MYYLCSIFETHQFWEKLCHGDCVIDRLQDTSAKQSLYLNVFYLHLDIFEHNMTELFLNEVIGHSDQH